MREWLWRSRRKLFFWGHLVELSVYLRAVHRRTKPPIRFVIFTLGRTGSELLSELLDAHPRITCDGENLSSRVFAPRLLVERSSALARDGAYGFKVKVDHITVKQKIADARGFLRSMHDDGWKFIHLERTDLLRHALSAWRLEQTRRGHQRSAHSTAGGSGARDVNVHVDPQGLIRHMRYLLRKREEEAIALHGLPRLHLTYEQDLAAPQAQQATVDRICDWLGLPRHPVSTSLVKLTPESLRRQIANYDEVMAALVKHDLGGHVPPNDAS